MSFAALALGTRRRPRRTSRERFKEETLPGKVEEVEAAHPKAKVTVWSMDEHRVGLKPILRRVWTRRGVRPIAVVWHRFESLQVSAFVHPETGENHWWLHDKVNTDNFNAILTEFAQKVGAGEKHQVILVLDGAGWHRAKKVDVPDGIHLQFLPPYSPELQPAERLWSLSDEPLVNRCFDSLDELRSVQRDRCLDLGSRCDEVRRRTLFHWWPAPSCATIL
jgi:transposase